MSLRLCSTSQWGSSHLQLLPGPLGCSQNMTQKYRGLPHLVHKWEQPQGCCHDGARRHGGNSPGLVTASAHSCANLGPISTRGDEQQERQHCCSTRPCQLQARGGSHLQVTLTGRLPASNAGTSACSHLLQWQCCAQEWRSLCDNTGRVYGRSWCCQDRLMAHRWAHQEHPVMHHSQHCSPLASPLTVGWRRSPPTGCCGCQHKA